MDVRFYQLCSIQHQQATALIPGIVAEVTAQGQTAKSSKVVNEWVAQKAGFVKELVSDTTGLTIKAVSATASVAPVALPIVVLLPILIPMIALVAGAVEKKANAKAESEFVVLNDSKPCTQNATLRALAARAYL